MEHLGIVKFFLVTVLFHFGASTEEPIREVKVTKGESVVLECGQGIKKSGWARWEIDRQKLYGRYSEDVEGLFIDYTRVSDSGIYTCTAVEESTGSKIEDKVKLIVEPSPLKVGIYHPFPVIYKTLGQELVSVCIVEDMDWESSIVSITWLDPEGRNVSTNIPKFSDPRSGRSVSFALEYGIQRTLLHIRDIQMRNAGKYTCRVVINNGTVTDVKDIDFELKLYEHPVPVQVTSYKELVGDLYSHSITLNCSGVTKENPAVAWEHNGKDLYNTYLLESSRYRFTSEGLGIDYANWTDAGIYTCRTRDETTGAVTDQVFNLTVIKPLTVEVPNPNITARPQSRVLLGCVVKMVDSTKTPIVEWKRQSEWNTLEYNDHYIQTEEGLLINDVTESDADRYFCIGKLPFGYYERQEINLTVRKTTLEDLLEVQEQTLQALNTVIDIEKQQQQQHEQQQQQLLKQQQQMLQLLQQQHQSQQPRQRQQKRW